MTSDVSGRGVSIFGASVYTGAWAGRPAAASFTGNTMTVTDIPIGGMSQWYSDGVNWRPMGGVVSIMTNNVPFIMPGAGSMANNGAVTLTTGFVTTTYPNGSWTYFPSNAIQAGSAAGWYFTKWTSTTVGQVFQETYTSGVPTIVASPTAWATTGPGAFAANTTEITGPSITIPGGVLYSTASLMCRTSTQASNTADIKTLRIKYGGTTIQSVSNTSIVGSGSTQGAWERGNSLQGIYASTGIGSTTINSSITIDNTVNQTFLISLQAAALILTLEYYEILLRG